MFSRTLKAAGNPRLSRVSFIHTKTGQDSSGIRNLKAQQLPQLQRQERVSEILNRVKKRDGLDWIPAHIQSLLGGDSISKSDCGEYSNRKQRSLDLSDKTQFIFKSHHPVRFFLER